MHAQSLQRVDFAPVLARLPRLVARPHALLAEVYALRAAGLFAALPRAPEDGDPYGRLVLHRDEHGEVMVASWGKGRACAPHDHGRAEGAVVVLAGRFAETLYRVSAGALVPVESVCHDASALLRVAPGAIHAMHALTGGHTLHVYAPAVHAMRIYDLVTREALTLADECGAFPPRDAGHVLARTPFHALEESAP